ncbi:MAG: baseplate J/gp47 family protein [Flavobacteriales bacterium]|nr:baseplate J/gp47 family protein [Flavobacteriales bacterium]
METCENKALIQRDGTNRNERLAEALLPEYVAVDERSMKDLITFVQQYAGEIAYVDIDNLADGDWKTFFNADNDIDILLDEDYSDTENFLDYVEKKGGFTQPHFALFLAFLKLFRKAQDDLNTITKRHLDFYYKEVLRLEEKPAVSDQVFLIFTLAKHIAKSHAVKENTELKAGKDDTGQPLFFATDDELVVNKGEVSAIKALFADVENTQRLYASPIANSSDGEGAEIESEDMHWEIFGNTDRDQPEIGFAFASPILFLAEGERTVTVTLTFSPETKIGSVFPHADKSFDVVFSGEEEWISPEGEDAYDVTDGKYHPQVVERILAFANSATKDDLDHKISDDPNTGYGDQIDDYDIGALVAERIVAKRNIIGSYTSLDQLLDVKGFGIDKLNDMAYTFRNLSNATIVDPVANTITIIRTIEESQPAVVAYNQEVLLEPYKTSWPVMKVTLNRDYPASPYVYKYLRDLDLTAANIHVNVSDVKSNIIQNDAARLDPAKPFQPFGNRPQLDASFYIGNQEIFQKNLETLTVNIQWHELPEEQSFGAYYANYTVQTGERQNTTFLTEVSLLDKREWTPVMKDGSYLQLFDNATDEEIINPVNNLFLSVANTGATDSLGDVKRDPEIIPFTQLDTTTQKGFLRMTLKGENFGHKDYPTSYTQQVLAGVTANPPVPPNLPNEPYTPTIKELSLDYSSSVDLNIVKQSEKAWENRVEQFFHVHPFGAAETDAREATNDLMPVITSEGSLYIGIENLTGGSNLSLLFQVAEGSANPDYLQQKVNWSYLAGNTWKTFNDRKILSDSTNGLLTSGIISFALPKEANTSHELLSDGLLWIRATVDKDTPAISDMVDIRAQAVTATAEDINNDPNRLGKALPAETIKKLRESDSAIDKVEQPFSSFGGKLKESSSAFYTRVSERLRHKQRAITIWDYERLVLEEFPSVYKVKCINHTIFNGTTTDYSEVAPGHVSLIVISSVINKNAVDPLKPKTSLITLAEIETFLTDIKAECVELHVRNPLYEEIQVELNVKFYDGIDNGYYQELLNDEIKAFLSPWAYEDSSDIVFGGRIHKSMILNFVEERDYVDYVTCFKMYHTVPSEGVAPSTIDINEARASTTGSVLGSAPEHLIHVMEEAICGCDENEVFGVKELAADGCGCD